MLQGVSFHVEPETVAFVGSTGSGKSTILSLICRNYGVPEEAGSDRRHRHPENQNFLAAPPLARWQDVFLFSGTIRSNIVLREESIPDDEIMKVCRYVNADRFISKLDHGLEEEVRERGNNFSGYSASSSVLRRCHP